MVKTKTFYVCQNCGAKSPRWAGKCVSCESWNSMVEERAVQVAQKHERRLVSNSDPVLLKDVNIENEKRFPTSIVEFDSVLGGGVVPGSVVLIGGDPGIGKSTLSLQMSVALTQQKCKVLYVSGEESIQQTKMRAQRLSNEHNEHLYILNQLDLNVILEHIKKLKAQVVVIDSVQVIYHSQLESAPGSVSQVRECAAMLTQLAKSAGIAIFIIGHVTKEGMIAGPRVLEHIVDTVLYFEGERYSSYRVLRATKNRFGSTNEIGVFEMTSAGLIEVTNPSEIFLAERPVNASGSVVVPMLEGTRPFLVEIQGLVSRSSFGMARQKAQGFDQNRLALLIAVLEKRLGLNIADKDVFLNVVGGVRIIDPAVDLAVVLAIASAFLEKPLSSDCVVLGEVGLSSEVRSVSQVAIRVKEAQKLGFTKCIIPKNNMKSREEFDGKAMDIIYVDSVQQALDLLSVKN